jgi:hypothetical protein
VERLGRDPSPQELKTLQQEIAKGVREDVQKELEGLGVTSPKSIEILLSRAAGFRPINDPGTALQEERFNRLQQRFSQGDSIGKGITPSAESAQGHNGEFKDRFSFGMPGSPATNTSQDSER